MIPKPAIDAPVTLILTQEGNFQVWSHMAESGVHLDIMDIAVLARMVRENTTDLGVLSEVLGDSAVVGASLARLRAARIVID